MLLIAFMVASLADVRHKVIGTAQQKDRWGARLKKHGFKETKSSIANKLARSTLTASFFLACLAAMELEGVVLEEI
jgi:hypothetical protein